MSTTFKRFSQSGLMALALMFSTPHMVRAETPHTDVQLIERMDGASSDTLIEALAVYYDLHVSELIVQIMNEQRTGAMFAVQRAKADNASADKLAMLEQKSKDVAAKRTAEIESNQSLRIQLEKISGIEFLAPLVMAPDTPMDKPVKASGELGVAQMEAWKALETAKAAWQEERLILLDAQQRYDETRDVPIGDHLRAMTLAEIALAKAVGKCRLIEAKIAAASGKNIAEMLGAL